MARPSDRLSDYHSKRDFQRTGEPQGKARSPRTRGLRFIVQKHDAQRLHYDLRLEWDGVLLSWAVTRGPSLDPGAKRLAVRTEDHPMSYADFEGTIPKGEYGGGTVMLWDRGEWIPEGDPDAGLAQGKLSFTLKGDRMIGRWALVRLRGKEKRENWLLIKERDAAATDDPDGLTEGADTSVATGRNMDAIARGDAASPVASPAASPDASDIVGDVGGDGGGRAAATARTGKRPQFRPVQLATLSDTAPEGDEWLHETKFDGYRALAALGNGGTRLYTRAGNDWTDDGFAALAGAFDRLPCDTALIDGEVMAATVEGSAFSSLRAALSAGGPLVFYAFDLIELDGKDLADTPLLDRKQALADLMADLPGDSALRLSDHVVGRGPEVFREACARGAEGIISKRIAAPYRGKRTRDWRKIKCSREQEFVIGGYRPSDKPARAFASILVGACDGQRLVYRGRVGTGFNARDFDALGKAMTARKTSPFDSVPADVAKTASWVRPELVAAIAFAEFTADGHIRHGSFRGLREGLVEGLVEDLGEDKTAAALSIETPEDEPMDATVLDITISNAGRPVFPDAGCTKLDIARHYARVGERMIALAGRRPLSLYRCPGGLGKACFFQKHSGTGMPDALGRIEVVEKDGKAEDYLYLTRPASLVAAAQMGTVEFHIWGSHTDRLERPDRLVFDLDPDEGLAWDDVRAAAFHVRDTLSRLGLTAGAIVTGGKGIHVWLPLRRTRGWDTVKLFAQTFANVLAERSPDRYTASMSKAKRRGRVFIDWLRNERGSTAIAPYSLRARKGAPVAVPLTWDELARLDSANGFGMGDMQQRLKAPCPAMALQGDLQTLSDKVIERLPALLTD